MQRTMTTLFIAAASLAVGAAAMYMYLARGRAPLAVSAEAAGSHAEDEHAAEAGGHEGHDEHEEGAHEEGFLRLPEETVRQFGIEVATAREGEVTQVLRTPCEMALNADRVAHIVPRVAGIVREVCKNVGDQVQAGDVLVVMDSRELAEAKAADLAAEAKLKLAEASHRRVEDLVKQKIASEQRLQESLQVLEEARIAHRGTIAKLHALGLTHDQVNAVPEQEEAVFSRYEIKAPFAGTIVDKHAALGEMHDSNSDMFLLADLSTVWAEVALYAQDMQRVQIGSKVRLPIPGANDPSVAVEGTIFYISPMIREDTRTGMARALIINDKGIWRPGLFITAEVAVGQEKAAVLVPNSAIQVMDKQPVVFVVDKDGYAKRPVTLGTSSETQSAVVSGLKVGERYVSTGAFVLKAELNKGSGGHEH